MHSVSLIIGNGFDLNLGLRTSYSDFLQSPHFPWNEDGASLAGHLQTRQEMQRWVDVEAELAAFSASQPSRATMKLEYKKLRESLCSYIQSVDTGAIDETSKAFNLFRTLAEAGPLNIISFNYTRTVPSLIQKLAANGINVQANVVNLHGTADRRDIIFGVDDHAGISERHSFLFKTSAVNFAGQGLLPMLLNSSETHWFGHSLGSPDHMYFRDYFSNIVDMQTNRTFHFYHYGEDGSDGLHTQLQALTQRRVAKFKSSHAVKLADVS